MTSQDELFLRLGLSLAIGFLIGVERGWKERTAEEGQRTAGVRTFSLIGLMGGVFGAISKGGNTLLLATGVAVLGVTLAAFMWREGERDNDLSATSLVAAMLTFMLGALAVLGDMAIAAGCGVAAAALLAAKAPLHGWVARLTWIELRAGLVLAAMTFILLPLLPNRPVDPLGVLNPYEIWLLTILIAVVSFLGYAAVKLAGPQKGIALAAAAGGLINSTAVSLTLARMALENPARVRLLSSSILLAGAVMFARVLFIVAVLNLPLAGLLLPGLIAAGLASAICSLWLMRTDGGQKGKDDLNLINPFRLVEVLRFGAILTAVIALSGAALRYLGSTGLLGVAAIAGLADVDAITISTARMDGGSPVPILILAIMIAVGANTAAKTIYAWVTGGRRIGIWVAAGSAIAIMCGVAAQLLSAQAGLVPSLKL